MNLIPLGSLFDTFDFETPDYQRGYAWLDEHVGDFWEDLCRLNPDNPQHFTGTLILETRSESGSDRRKAIIVDGQQRLTTVVLLACAIAETLEFRQKAEDAARFRSKFLGSIEKPRFRYSTTHDSWPYLAAHVYKDPNYLAKAADHESAYTRNIAGALSRLRCEVEELDELQIESLIEKLTTKLIFSVVGVDSQTFNIHVAFETINHRGRQLTKLELLKNRIIYVTTLLRTPDGTDSNTWASARENLRSNINGTWSDIYSWLGRGGKDALDDEEFLRTHAIMYFDVDTSTPQWLDNLLFKEEFSANRAASGALTETSLKQYLSSLRISAVLWSHIKRPRNIPGEQILWLNRINHVHRPLFDPLVLAAYVRLVALNPELVTDLRRTEGQDGKLISVLKEIERFNVLVYLTTGRRAHTGRKDFWKKAHQFHAMKEDFHGRTTDEALAYLSRYIHACVDNISDTDPEAFSDDQFEWSGWLDLEMFRSTITGLLRDGEGYYSHEWTRVILFEYEESLRAAARGGAALVGWDRVSADTIEHIYPQDDTHWADLTEKLGGKRKKHRINSYKHSLGNLLLLSRSKNASLQNLPYSGKDEKKAKRARFAKGSHSETEVATRHSSWGQQAIERRGKALLQFAETRWNFSFKKHGVKYEDLLTLK